MVIVSVCSMFLVIQVGLNKSEKAKASAQGGDKLAAKSNADYRYQPVPRSDSEKASPGSMHEDVV